MDVTTDLSQPSTMPGTDMQAENVLPDSSDGLDLDDLVFDLDGLTARISQVLAELILARSNLYSFHDTKAPTRLRQEFFSLKELAAEGRQLMRGVHL